MGTVKPQPLVKLFTSITFNVHLDIDNIYATLINLFNRIELKTEIFNFSKFTNYYESEMGPELSKQILVFTGTIEPETLPAIKLSTNDLERRYSSEDMKRQVNIDPGYLCAAKVVLATTKDYTHRIYLGQGIYGDVHLCYQHHSFQVQPWTYPDYRQPDIIDFFNQVRIEYIKQLKTFEL
jgi:hypothetical protein